jgi:hypothetical protein
MMMVSPMRAAWPNSWVMRRTVAAGMVVNFSVVSGGYLATCSRSSSNAGRPRRPCAS